MLTRESHVSQHICLALIHEIGQLWPAVSKLVGDMSPRFTGMQSIWSALLFVLVLLKIGDDANYEFIYFQF